MNYGIQGDDFSGKPGNVGEFDSFLGKVRELTKIHRNVRIIRKKSCQGKPFVVSVLFGATSVF